MQDALAIQKEFYKQDEDRLGWQLNRFNKLWQATRRTIPFYATKANRYPKSFDSWEQFITIMPVINRKTMQTEREHLATSTRPPDFMRTTGGSTSEPVQLPSWNEERTYGTYDLWYGRSWYKVTPADRLVMFWGHSHLLGEGVRGWVNGRKRMFKDWLLGYLRWSAYDLSEAALRRAAEATLRFRPTYLIAYAGALDRFTRVNQDRAADFHQLKLKVAIATAESFPRADSAEFIAGVLGCPVIMEYGAVETGPIAYQTKEGNYFIFWRHYFVEAAKSDVPNAGTVRVTSLYPRCMPLIRYELGDLITAANIPSYGLQQFDHVLGRCNDFILLEDGRPVHSEAFTHAVKESPSIADFQVKQQEAGSITLSLVGIAPITPAEIEKVRSRLGKVTPQLAGVEIKQIDSLEKTIAGKTKRIVRVGL